MKEYEYEDKIMGSDAAISIVASDKSLADEYYARMRACAEDFEARFSRFRKESELSRLNEQRTMRVSKEFMDVFLLSRELSVLTKYAFNPLVTIARFGYDEDIARVKGTERTRTTEKHPYNTAIENVLVDESSMTITLQEGQLLDFGGFLKGHVAQRMAECIPDDVSVISNVGGDIYTRGLDESREVFRFTIDNPVLPSERVFFLARDSGIATSGSYNRHWSLEGKPFSHILDQSGQKNPETDVVSATVLANSGAEADAFATIPIVLGSREGERLLSSLGVEYFLICTNGSTKTSPLFPLVSNVFNPSYA